MHFYTMSRKKLPYAYVYNLAICFMLTDCQNSFITYLTLNKIAKE